MTEHDHDLAVEMYGECPTCAVEAMAEATGRPSPLARNSDPWSSHVAAARIEPTRGTRKALVLALLRGRAGEWVDGSAIATAEVGGSEGLRRLRELREDNGWPIERRPHPERATSWQYRLPRDRPERLPLD